jgi:hypothetical protein
MTPDSELALQCFYHILHYLLFETLLQVLAGELSIEREREGTELPQLVSVQIREEGREEAGILAIDKVWQFVEGLNNDRRKTPKAARLAFVVTIGPSLYGDCSSKGIDPIPAQVQVQVVAQE